MKHVEQNCIMVMFQQRILVIIKTMYVCGQMSFNGITYYFPHPFYISKYRVKTLVVQEGFDVILRYVHGELKFLGNTLWYKGKETINPSQT